LAKNARHRGGSSDGARRTSQIRLKEQYARDMTLLQLVPDPNEARIDGVIAAEASQDHRPGKPVQRCVIRLRVRDAAQQHTGERQR
jgi:hypothetical protein